jgi:hypothetical protein
MTPAQVRDFEQRSNETREHMLTPGIVAPHVFGAACLVHIFMPAIMPAPSILVSSIGSD